MPYTARSGEGEHDRPRVHADKGLAVVAASTVHSMRISLLSDQTTGGAAIVCRRLMPGLSVAAETRWVSADAAWEQGTLSASAWPSVGSWLTHRVASVCLRDPVWLQASRNRFHGNNVARVLRQFDPDVINIHNLHEAMAFDVITSLPGRARLVWTLHDMWPLTGYCYQSCGCAKFVAGCRGECPEAGHCGAAWRTPADEWVYRQSIFRRMLGRLSFVAPSRWMQAQAERRLGASIPVAYIPNGVDTTVFIPLGVRTVTRQALGLPEDRRMILTGAQALSDQYKGGAVVLELARAFPDTMIVAFGHWKSVRESPPNLIAVGYVRDERLLNLYYNAADVFVLPSRAENLPNTLVESIAAGTPVVAFDVGGCCEIARDDQTGFVVPSGDVAALIASIRRVLDATPSTVERWRAECRGLAERQHDVTMQVERYLARLSAGRAPGIRLAGAHEHD